MKHEYRLADIGEGLEEAEIVTWLVSEGDLVTRDQPLIEVMTDKSNAELPSPVSGVVVRLHGAVGDIVEVGALIATIDESADPAEHAALEPSPDALPAATIAADDPPPPPPSATLPPTEPQSVAAAPTEPESSTAGAVEKPAGRPKASPSTRRIAAERGIDLTMVAGTGPGGRILLSDLEGAPAREGREPVTSAVTDSHEPTRSPSPSESAQEPAVANTAGVVPLRGVRRAVAENMTRSWTEVPHIHTFQHIDAEPLLEMRRRLKETSKTEYEHLTPLAFFVAAVTRALTSARDANTSLDTEAGTITYHETVNVGIAVAADRGLVVPVVHDAGRLDFPELTRSLTELILGARDGSLSPESYRGGTVTITNFGALGGEQAVPIIRSPESMIFGFGSIASRPFVIDDEVVARKTLHLVAGADHRLLDGDVTTTVLNSVATSLTDPLRLVL